MGVYGKYNVHSVWGEYYLVQLLWKMVCNIVKRWYLGMFWSQSLGRQGKRDKTKTGSNKMRKKNNVRTEVKALVILVMWEIGISIKPRTK